MITGTLAPDDLDTTSGRLMAALFRCRKSASKTA
jgi:hypothetical protein